ncbi:MAG: hypothetical protein GEU78_12280 [Actinobacteria bacterium]|nr:hypothetical protein [Actinomycetota bacterium]
MPVVRYVSEQRRKQIYSHVAPHLSPGEEIVHFARIRQPDTRKRGFIYMTGDRVIVAWKSDGEPVSIGLSAVTSWAVTHDLRGGPVLTIETPEQAVTIQLLTASRSMTDGAIHFLLLFSELIPDAAVATLEDGEESHLSRPHLHVRAEPRSVSQLTKRILVTLLGVTLIVGAILIVPLPGPWSFLVTIAGLAVLASEYDWAEDALDWVKLKYKRAKQKIKARRKARSEAQSRS